jgi:hypothetical protein
MYACKEGWIHARQAACRNSTQKLPHVLQVEVLQFGTMLKLLSNEVDANPDSTRVLQDRAFNFVLEADRFLSGAELGAHRAQLVKLCHEVIGQLSRSASRY